MFISIILVLIVCVQPALADDFVLNSDGSVADLASGLVWQGSSVDIESAQEAVSYCAQIQGNAQLSWRLPSRFELANLETHLNTLTPTTYWVTQKTSAKTGVYCFGDGAFFTAPVALESAWVRCVCENPLAPVVDAVNDWVESWQNGDIDGYLSAYGADFKPGPHMEHRAWVQQRRRRLAAAKDLKIALQTERITALNKKSVEIFFLQDYHSSHYQDRVRKRLVLNRLQGRWLITREEQLSRLPQQTISSTSVGYR